MRTPHTVFQRSQALKKARTLIVLLIAVAPVSISAPSTLVSARTASIESTVVLQTATVPMLTGTFQVVNDGPGEQVDPHIACDLVSYTDDDDFGFRYVGYFDFTTNTNHRIPGNGTASLSDVKPGLVVYTEAATSGSVIGLFNIATQSRTNVPGFHNSHPAVGGNIVVYENRSFSSNTNESEISVYDLSTGAATRLTNDALLDRNPRISSTGNAIVWEKCQTNGLDCDVYAAIQTVPGIFTTRALTSGNGEDRGARTNGEVAVYLSDRSGENDIYLQPLAGGPETHLSLLGEQRQLSIVGNLIAFETSATGPNGQHDIFVYDLSTAQLHQVTNTPVDEALSELSVCNGSARIVYTALATDYNVYAFTFQVPSSVPSQIDDLIELVESFGLSRGPENSLVTKLDDALAAVEASDAATTCNDLTAFINECQAQSGKKLTVDQATQLINSANQIKTDLGCQ